MNFPHGEITILGEIEGNAKESLWLQSLYIFSQSLNLLMCSLHMETCLHN